MDQQSNHRTLAAGRAHFHCVYTTGHSPTYGKRVVECNQILGALAFNLIPLVLIPLIRIDGLNLYLLHLHIVW